MRSKNRKRFDGKIPPEKEGKKGGSFHGKGGRAKKETKNTRRKKEERLTRRIRGGVRRAKKKKRVRERGKKGGDKNQGEP